MKLELHFGEKVNVTLERHKFFTRIQGRQESVLSYVAVLRGLANLCEFGALNDSLIKDQVTRCTNSTKIQEKLLAKNPSLQEAIEIARSVEHTAQCIKELKPVTETVNEIKKSSDTYTSNKLKNKKEEKEGQTYDRDRLKCFRCGSTNHLANSNFCQARGSTCRKCGKKGHFSRVCRDGGVKWVGESPEVKDNDTIVLEIEDEGSKGALYPKCNISIEGKIVSVFADSCSPYTLINMDDFKDICNVQPIPLEAADITPSGYNKDPIPIAGMIKVNIDFKGRTTFGKVYIADKGSNLLGWQHQKELGIILDPNNRDQVLLIDRSTDRCHITLSHNICHITYCHVTDLVT